MGHLHCLGRPTRLNRWAWLAGCTALFLIVYGGTNWLASQRADVGLWFWQWELQIPFVPWMIVPYWSIDLFFLGAFFVCRTKNELRAHGTRIALAILVAGIFFLLFPLRIAFPRPEVSGIFGTMFTALRLFDQPHNLFPSLHITLWALLRDAYVRHTRGWLRWGIRLWFLLIAVSTVFTWQHQIVDVLGGLGLAVLCFYFVRETPLAQPVMPNYRVAGCYAAGGIAMLAIGGWMAWPGIGLFLAAAGYCGLGAGIDRKENGRLPLSAKVLLAPLLLGQYLSWLYYRRQSNAWDEVAPGVWIGRWLTGREAQKLPAQAVLDLTAEFEEPRELRSRHYLNVPILDLTAPTSRQVQQAVAFIARHASDGGVYVHCKIGYSRSAAVVGAYLVQSGLAADADAALRQLRRARPGLIIRPEAENVIRNLGGGECTLAVAGPRSPL